MKWNISHVNKIKERYLRPKNCEMLVETRFTLALEQPFRDAQVSPDLNILKVKKSLIRGSIAVVQVVNDLIGEPDMPSKDQIVNQLMDSVVLMANANIELNLRHGGALKPGLHQATAILIITKLFGDDLPNMVKHITDTNRIISELSRKTKKGFKRGMRGGERWLFKEPKLSHGQNIEVMDRKLLAVGRLKYLLSV